MLGECVLIVGTHSNFVLVRRMTCDVYRKSASASKTSYGNVIHLYSRFTIDKLHHTLHCELNNKYSLLPKHFITAWLVVYLY